MSSTRTLDLTLCEVADASAYGVESFSPYCLKAHRALRLAGLSYSRRHGARPDAFRALNRTGQVPVLLVGERAIPDSTEILRWLVDQRRLEASPEAWLWEELADTSLSGFLVAARWLDEQNWPRTKAAFFGGMPAPVRAIVPALIRRGVRRGLVAREHWRRGPEECWGRLERLLDALDARAPAPGVGWLGGGWTVADLGLFAQLRSLDTSLTPRQGQMVRARSRLSGWIDGFDSASRLGLTRAA